MGFLCTAYNQFKMGMKNQQSYYLRLVPMQINKQTKCSGWNQLFIDVIGSGFTQDSFQGVGRGGSIGRV